MTTDPKFKIRRLWRDKRGAALVLVALSLTALIGMTGLAVRETADAMEREIGFDVADGRPRLRWVLRRIVADRNRI